jgi:hypothetical protein
MSTASSTAGGRARSHLDRRTLTVQELLGGVSGWRRLAHLWHYTLHASRTHHWLACTAQWSCDLITTCNFSLQEKTFRSSCALTCSAHTTALRKLCSGWRLMLDAMPGDKRAHHKCQRRLWGHVATRETRLVPSSALIREARWTPSHMALASSAHNGNMVASATPQMTGRQRWAGTNIALGCQKATLCNSLAPQRPCKALAQCLSWLQHGYNITAT